MTWDPAALPSQAGKTIVVTGANAGLGYFTSEALARAGAHVVLACRNPARAEAAVAAIRRRVVGASVSTVRLDVSALDSVEIAATQLLALPRVDALILNAGIVHPPQQRQESVDGHELVFATNFLGHFALTARLMPALLTTPGSRVVALGSMISRLMDSTLDDVELVRHYNPWTAYAQSKIEMQVFGFELDRRLRDAGVGDQTGVRALVAHPGYSISGRTPGVAGLKQPSRRKRFVDNLQASVAQGKDRGAWPIVRAAIDPLAEGGQYYGPRFMTKGSPVAQVPTPTSLDRDVAARLWVHSEEAAAVTFPL